MEHRTEALALLGEKQRLLREVEERSEQMLALGPDRLEEAVNHRLALLQKVEQLDRRLRSLCGEDAALRAALNQTGPQTDPQLAQLARAALQARATANRIVQGDPAVRRHMLAQRALLKSKIEKLNRGGGAVAKRYRQAMETGHTPWRQKKSRNF